MTTKRKVDRERGERIKFVRRDLLDIKAQERFAELLAQSTGRPITRGAIGNWELGKEIGLESLKAIAEVADISLDWLAYNAGEPPTKGDRLEQRSKFRTIPVMGYLGAGAEIEPEFEQVPPEGLDQVELPFALNEDLIAFKVRGDSMLPFYRDGAVIVVYRDQKKPLEQFYGEEAAVRTRDGRRFIKTVMRGNSGVNLISWNAPPIENVQLEWVGEVFAVLPASSLRKVERQGGVQGQLRLRSA